ncbi:hypothetical protein GOBAR_DD18233 [Gossypium barbadense]|nr:hypothetical protein GOBAR_DD18233 [Gossypium barbadense]
MKVEGLSTQVKIQALQLDLMLQSSSDTGTRCAVMGKVPLNEYFFSRVLVANDPVDDFDKILGKIEMLSFYVVVDKGPFLSFSKARADGFQYVLSSKGFLPICNVRTPMVPLLCWAHNLDTTCFIDVIRSSIALSFLFNNISLPTSICEATTTQMWATFPSELLLLVFSSHPKLLDVPFDDMTIPLEFSIVPDLPQLPPFLVREPSCLSTK